MALSGNQEVLQHPAPKPGEAEHPDLDPGDLHIKGVAEANGPNPLCSPQAKLSGSIISLSVTPGGGIAYEFGIHAEEPAPPPVPEAPAPEPSPEEKALAFLVGAGHDEASAKATIEKLGAARVLAAAQAELDRQAAEAVQGK